jgi:hypothetical protein
MCDRCEALERDAHDGTWPSGDGFIPAGEVRMRMGVLREALDEAHAAIRLHREALFNYRSLAYQYAPLPIDLDSKYEALLDGDAPAIRRATNQPTPPDPEPPFHFCDQIRENLVDPKSACEFCRATGQEP